MVDKNSKTKKDPYLRSFRINISAERKVSKIFTYSTKIEAKTLEAAFKEAKAKARIMNEAEPETLFFVSYVNIS